MRLIKYLFFLTILLSLISCNAVNDMKGMFEKQAQVQGFIKNKSGLSCQVGWNMHNGVLTKVTVSFNADEVRDKKVSELESLAIEAIKDSFASKPRAINVNIATKM